MNSLKPLEAMKIGLDKMKYKKRMISLLLFSFAFSMCFIMIIIMNIPEYKIFELKKIFISIGLLLFLSLFTYLLCFYNRLKEIKDCVIVLENGELNDYSKPFNRASFLKIDDIKSISFWRQTQGINQFKIVTKDANSNAKLYGLFNQLKGNHIYISDYVIETEKLLSLVKLIEKNVCNHKP